MSRHRLAADRDEHHVSALPPHVVRIPLPLPLPDLRVVNVYAILGDDGVTLVDSGWADEPSETVIVEALDRLGFAPEDVRRVVVTHAHWDHYSRAIGWQRRYGTTVMIGRHERHTIEAFDERTGAYPVQAQLLHKAGAIDLAEAIANFPLEPFERDVPFGPPDVWLDEVITPTAAESISWRGPRQATPEATSCTKIAAQTSCSPVTTSSRASHRRSGWNERPRRSRCGPTSRHSGCSWSYPTRRCCRPTAPLAQASKRGPRNSSITTATGSIGSANS